MRFSRLEYTRQKSGSSRNKACETALNPTYSLPYRYLNFMRLLIIKFSRFAKFNFLSIDYAIHGELSIFGKVCTMPSVAEQRAFYRPPCTAIWVLMRSKLRGRWRKNDERIKCIPYDAEIIFWLKFFVLRYPMHISVSVDMALFISEIKFLQSKLSASKKIKQSKLFIP